jgi:6-phosphogluconolactonase (cycloisomerase 2 family)
MCAALLCHDIRTTEDFKFIYITQEEMNKVASFILDSQEGTLKQLASETTNLIATTSSS